MLSAFRATAVTASRFTRSSPVASRAFSSPTSRKNAADPAIRNYATAAALMAWVGGVYYYSIFKIKAADDLEEILELETLANEKVKDPKN